MLTDEVGVGARLDHHARIEHIYSIYILNGVESMGDHDACAAHTRLVERVLHNLFGPRV